MANLQMLNSSELLHKMEDETVLVWINLSAFQRKSTYVGQNCYKVYFSDIPIYAVGAASTISNINNNSCRGGLSSIPNPYFVNTESHLPARIWFAGLTTYNKYGTLLAYKADNGSYTTDYLSYDTSGWEANKNITLYDGRSVNDIYLYYNNDVNKISSKDLAGAGVVYFYIYQVYFPASQYYAQIKQSDLQKILNS